MSTNIQLSPSEVILACSAITAVCAYFVQQMRQKSYYSAKVVNNPSKLAGWMMDEMMQNAFRYEDVTNIDNVRTGEPINTPELDRIPWTGDMMQFQNRMVSNLAKAYQVPNTTADQATIGYYMPSRAELAQYEWYNRDY